MCRKRKGEGAEPKYDDSKERVDLYRQIRPAGLVLSQGPNKFIIRTSLHVRSAVRSYCHCQPGRAMSANSHAVFSLQIDNNVILKSLFTTNCIIFKKLQIHILYYNN